MARGKTQQEFTATYIAPLQADDTAFHAMAFPGLYPDPFDIAIHQALLAGERVQPSHPFFDLTRELVARQVHVQWLRVIPHEGQFGYSRADIAAMRAGAAAIAEASGVDMRIVDHGRTVRAIQRQLPDSPLSRAYLGCGGTNSPQASFWRVDTADAQPVAVNIMNYTDGTYDGPDIYTAPVADDMVAYTNIFRGVYRDEATPVNEWV